LDSTVETSESRKSVMARAEQTISRERMTDMELLSESSMRFEMIRTASKDATLLDQDGTAIEAVRGCRVARMRTCPPFTAFFLSHSCTEEIMSRLSWTQRLYWRYFAKPASERDLSMYVLENPVVSILEIGLGTGDRFQRLIPLIKKSQSTTQIRYAGVDPFESATDTQPHMSLKQAHRVLAELGVKAHLIPGDSESAIARVANLVLPSDLIIVDGQWEADSAVGRAVRNWLPRLCHDQTAIFASSEPGQPLVSRARPASVVERQALRRAA
jgi:hypothetical protein